MANATITSLATDLITVPVDSTQVDTYQDELILELARMAKPGVLVQTGAVFVAGVRGTVEYTLPAASAPEARTILTVHYDDRQLAHTRKTEAEMVDPGWRKSLGVPLGFITDPNDRTKFSLMPVPDRNGAAIGTSTPFDLTPWPDSNITVIHTRTDTTYPGDTDNYLDTFLPIALEVIARELGRDSNHKDPEAAQVAQQLADVFWRLSFPPEN